MRSDAQGETKRYGIRVGLSAALSLAIVLGPAIASACAPRIYVGNGLFNVAVVSTKTLNMTANIPVTTSGGVVWGLGGKADGTRVYAATSENQIVTINGSTESILRRDTLGTANCFGPYGVASWPDGSRLAVICADRVLLYQVSSDLLSLRDTRNISCSLPVGYDLQTTGTAGSLHIACEGTNGGIVQVSINGFTLSGSGSIATGCGSATADVCLQNFNLGCDQGGIVCEPFSPDTKRVISFYDAGCCCQDKMNHSGPFACAHVQTGGGRFWILSQSNNLELVKPLASPPISGIPIAFQGSKVVPNFVTGTSAYVIGFNGTAEVDNNGVILRQLTGIANLDGTGIGADSVFVGTTSPAICGTCP